MPFVNGVWMSEDDGVGSRVAAITSTDSPIMRQATAMGERGANRRGLMNSSMGVGAGVDAAIRTAVPIASQEAQQTYGKNMQRMQNDQSDKGFVVERERIKSSERASAADNLTRLNANYTSGIANTLQNDKIPGATRTAIQQDFAQLYQADLQKIKMLYPETNWG